MVTVTTKNKPGCPRGDKKKKAEDLPLCPFKSLLLWGLVAFVSAGLAAN
jgi:hypothetical protein